MSLSARRATSQSRAPGRLPARLDPEPRVHLRARRRCSPSSSLDVQREKSAVIADRRRAPALPVLGTTTTHDAVGLDRARRQPRRRPSSPRCCAATSTRASSGLALDDADEDSSWARASTLPLDGFDRAAALLALEIAAGLLGDEALADARPRAARRAAPARWRSRRPTRARARRSPRPPDLGAERHRARRRAGSVEHRARHRATPILRDTGESVLFMHELDVRARAIENVPMLRWLLVASDWVGRPARPRRAAGRPGAVRGLRRARAHSSSRRRSPSGSSRSCGSPTTTTQDGPRVSAEMVITIAFYAAAGVRLLLRRWQDLARGERVRRRRPAGLLAVQRRAVARRRPRDARCSASAADPDRRRHRRPTSSGKDSPSYDLVMAIGPRRPAADRSSSASRSCTSTGPSCSSRRSGATTRRSILVVVLRVLLTNDDGIEAEGLQALRRALLAVAGRRARRHRARRQPLRHRAARSPRAARCGSRRSTSATARVGYATDGTPVDCVRFAVARAGRRLHAPT